MNIVEKEDGQKGAHRAIVSSSIRFFSVVSLQFFSPIPTTVLHTRSHTRSAQRKQVNADAHAHPASLDPGLASRHDSDKHLSIPFLYLFYLSRPPSISISATMSTRRILVQRFRKKLAGLIISWNLIFLNESILSLSSLIIETISLKYALVIFQIQSGKLNLKFKLVSSFREEK